MLRRVAEKADEPGHAAASSVPDIATAVCGCGELGTEACTLQFAEVEVKTAAAFMEDHCVRKIYLFIYYIQIKTGSMSPTCDTTHDEYVAILPVKFGN